MPEQAIGNNVVPTFFRFDEGWRLFAIFAGLAVRYSGSADCESPLTAADCLSSPTHPVGRPRTA